MKKFTMSKLDCCIFFSCVIVAILCITLISIIVSRDKEINNELVVYETVTKTDAPTTTEEITTTIPETTQSQDETTYQYDVYEDGTQVTASDKLQAEIRDINSWGDNKTTYVQYDINLTNISDTVISDWNLVIVYDDAVTVSENWGGTCTAYEERLEVVPVAYTKELQPGETKNIGVILYAEKYPYAIQYSIKMDGISQSISLSAQEAEKNDDATDRDNTNYTTTQQTTESKTQEEQTTAAIPTTNIVTGDYQAHGVLQVSGTNLYDSNGNIFQLKGVSTHGLSWFPEYVNREAFSSLKNFGVNAIRLAMYTSEYNGYCNGGNKEDLKKLVMQGVNLATELGMYVVIDWHILSDGNPNTYKNDAITFFDEMSRTYASHGNVLYEICNEPNGGTSWSEIKSYAEEIIPVIRKNDADAIIIVGTPTWSQDVDLVSQSPLDSNHYSNILYALHFYAGTHKDDLRNKFQKAYENGLPMIVSEFSICDASGNGYNDTTSANQWMELLNSYGISYVAWNLSNKNESSSILNSSCTKTGQFSQSDFSESGRWYLTQLGSFGF